MSRLPLPKGEFWTDTLHQSLEQLEEGERSLWSRLFLRAADAKSAKPSAKWQKGLRDDLDGLDLKTVREQFLALFARFPEGRSGNYQKDESDRYLVNNKSQDTLRGMVWVLASDPWPALGGALADLLVASLKKVPWQGPRAVKVANACIYGLGQMALHPLETNRMAALAQLAKLKARVSFKTTLNAIQKALEKAAESSGLSLEELEELGVPSFGFVNGEQTFTFGQTVLRMRIDKGKVISSWTNDKGKAVKSVPAAVRREHAEEVKNLKRIIKDAEAVLSATRSRIDSLFLQEKSWSLADWRDRYLDHGLVGSLARRLIWEAGGAAFMMCGETPTDLSGDAIHWTGNEQVRLWHPIGKSTEEVIAWRERVETAEIVQPFKQAHREVYVLTDAERSTSVYSNRFAAHIVKQHQYNALAGGRGWRNQLRLMVDDFYEPTSRELPAHDLRAEFWVEGVGENYGTDTTESGTFLHLATDQLRFYRRSAAGHWIHASGGGYESDAGGAGEEQINEPVPLHEIPPIVLSEIMRDVYLFVGVAGVANDPNWADGGREERYRDYWHRVSFGELSATAETRRELLERVLPKLKIAERCRLEGRFLVVRGEVRTYKIHLGSGNILMTPNDQYLCIVPGGRKDPAATVFLPFEGDRVLSIILSKAFMLADDTHITDETILSQINV